MDMESEASCTIKEGGLRMTTPAKELKVVVLNINMGHNKELMEACRTLWEYAEYVRRVRLYREEMSI